MDIVVYPNNRNLSSPDAIPKTFEGFADRIAKLMEFAVDCGVCDRDSKAGEEAVDEAIGIAGEEDNTCDLGEEGDRFVSQIK